MTESLTLLHLLRFAVVFAAFLFPGYGLVSWLLRTERFGVPLRLALGFAWSVGLFGLVGGPFLWLRGEAATFRTVAYVAWAVYLLVGTIAYVRWRKFPCPTEEPDAAGSGPSSLSWRTRLTGVLFAAAYLAVAAAFGFAWTGFSWLDRLPLLGEITLSLLVVGAVFAAVLWRKLQTLVRLDASDHASAPPLWTWTALGMILFQAGSAVAYSRPDWDDAWYLAAMLDYQHTEQLNDQEPTHREGYSVPVIQHLLCWELWGAVVCRLTGLMPLVLFHTVLPGVLVLLAYAGYDGLLREFVPRRWVPLALLGLAAVHLWGISSHMTAANYLLPRLWQGKAVLAHLVVPLCVLLTLRALDRPSLALAASLVACTLFGLAVSLTAVFLLFMLLTALPVAVLLADGMRRWRNVWPIVAGLVPVVLVGLMVRAALAPEAAGLAAKRAGEPTWMEWVWLKYAVFGSAEVVWFLTLPFQAVLLAGRRRAAYPIAFSAVALLVYGNPLVYDWVASRLTTYHTYFRQWWLLPIGPGLGVLFALTTRLTSRCLGLTQTTAGPLALGLAGLALTLLLPGMYVWSPRNNWLGPLGEPHLAENPEKLPAGLLTIARELAAEPNLSEGRILCEPQAASFLTGFSRDFRFVMVRSYTVGTLVPLGRQREAAERYLLCEYLRYGAHLSGPIVREFESWCGEPLEQELAAATSQNAHAAHFATLAGRHRVRDVLVSPGLEPGDLLPAAGFRLVAREGPFEWWRRGR